MIDMKYLKIIILYESQRFCFKNIIILILEIIINA